MRQILIIVTFFSLSTSTYAHNPFWKHTDKKLINAIIRLDKNNPKEIEQFFKRQRIQKIDTTKENLGFGWSMWETGFVAGYISISATFYYYNDSIVSYSLNPGLPEERKLIKRYKKWYRNYFNYTDSLIQPFKFNETATLKPLKECNGDTKNIPSKIIHYMTPESGTMYGYAGGGMILDNRKAFNEIKDSLTKDQVILMLYAINPASRLTAIEYYWRHKDKFGQQELVDKWIEQNFKEMPTVESMDGCFLVTKETRSLVYTYSLIWKE
jgi:hypothetical protein